MATIANKLKQIAETPENKAADRLWLSIEDKLNFDGRYSLLNPAESMLRYGRLTNEESEYMGRVMGWSTPYHKGVDWNAVSTPFLSECVMKGDDGIDLLRQVYPAPVEASQIDWARVPENEIDMLNTNKLSLKMLVDKYPIQEGVQP